MNFLKSSSFLTVLSWVLAPIIAWIINAVANRIFGPGRAKIKAEKAMDDLTKKIEFMFINNTNFNLKILINMNNAVAKRFHLKEKLNIIEVLDKVEYDMLGNSFIGNEVKNKVTQKVNQLIGEAKQRTLQREKLKNAKKITIENKRQSIWSLYERLTSFLVVYLVMAVLLVLLLLIVDNNTSLLYRYNYNYQENIAMAIVAVMITMFSLIALEMTLLKKRNSKQNKNKKRNKK
nr:MAG: hypothetical protein [Bacteriophage sp.]